MEQIFAYTEPDEAPSLHSATGAYVRFLAVHRLDNGSLEFQIRDSAGWVAKVALPKSAAEELGMILVSGCEAGA